jgi:hypothetical protein
MDTGTWPQPGVHGRAPVQEDGSIEPTNHHLFLPLPLPAIGAMSLP